MELLEQKLQELHTDFAAYIAKANAEQAERGRVDEGTKETLRQIRAQVDAIDTKMQQAAIRAATSDVPLADVLKENEDIVRMLKDGRGRAKIEFKGATLDTFLNRKEITASTLGATTTGVMPAEREAGITLAPRPKLRMRDVLPARPTNMQQIDWITESVRPTKASPVAAAGLKPLTDVALAAHTEPVQTIALLMLATNQVLADFQELEGFLRSELAQRVRQEEDMQILFGDGSSNNLHGITHQAQAWDLTLLTASDGYEYIDMIAGAMQQIAEDDENEENQFVVLNPGDWWKIRRLKDSTGRYMFGDPHTPFAPTLWGAPVVDTTCMTKGYFLVGSGSARCAEIRDRMGVTVEMSTEDSDNFRYNRVTFRVENRLALVVKRPNAHVYGALTQSPA
jgi:HK97 family phage major capsid protein